MLVALQKNRLLLAFISSAVFLLFVANSAFAQDTVSEGFNIAQNIGGGAFGTTDIREVIVNIVNIALGFLGIIAVIIIIYAGWLWMTSAGNPDQVDSAKKTLRNAVIGLGVIIASWAIVGFFVNQFIAGTGGGGPNPPPSIIGNGALGAGIIESVYPPPNATGIPRNTLIFVTFKEPMDVASIDNGGVVREVSGNPVVRIVNIQTGTALTGAEVQVQSSGGGRVFAFDPVPLLGTNAQPQQYRVELTDQILKADLSPAFPGAVSGVGFAWQFVVSTIVDVTPPTLVSFLPIPNPSTSYPRNVLVQMAFSEAINPITISPSTVTINDITNGGTVTGTLFQGADYQTVEFLPDGQCEGQPLNTCGEPVFCLPANASFRPLVTAAGVSAPFSIGIQDAAGNSFDGNSNGTPEGPGVTDFDLAQPASAQPGAGDNAFWEFATNNTIDLIPPAVIQRIPDSGDASYPLRAQLSIKMDKHLAISTLRPDASYNDGKEYVTLVDPRQEVGYYITGTNGNGCSVSCVNQGSSSVFGSTCGNGTVDQGEDCDDGNTIAGDSCSADCLNEGTGVCGDGVVTHHEECDPAADPWLTGGQCDPVSCLLLGPANGSCGGNIAGSNCCGNGIVEPGEACDSTSDPGCDPTQCLYLGNAATCGNGILEFDQGESCDYGNAVPGDGCSATCTLEGSKCGDGNIDIGEDCDTPGVNGCSNFCQNSGNFLTCGDNTIDPGEDCDLGPVLNESFIFLNHTGFAESSQYGVRLGSGIRDSFQNCFLPSADSAQAATPSCLTQASGVYVYGLGPVPPWQAPPSGPFPSCILP